GRCRAASSWASSWPAGRGAPGVGSPRRPDAGFAPRRRSLHAPCACRGGVGAVLRQALVVERGHVVLVPAVGLVHAQQHLLLAGREGVPRLGRDLVGGRQVVLLLVGAHGVGAIAGRLLRLRGGLALVADADARAPHLSVAAASDLLLLGLQAGGLRLDAGGRSAARDVVAHRRGVQVAHALRRGAQHLLVLGPVGRTAQVGKLLQVGQRVLLGVLRLGRGVLRHPVLLGDVGLRLLEGLVPLLLLTGERLLTGAVHPLVHALEL